MKNIEVASILYEIGEILEILGENPFKARAYYKAARLIEGMPQQIEEAYSKGELTKIPGIGKSIAEKISELLETGKLAYYEELKQKIPPNLINLLEVPALGPKKILLIWKKYKVSTIEEIESLAKNGKLKSLPGFGPKVESNILQGIELYRARKDRTLLGIAYQHALQIVERLKELPQTKRISIAGSTRRMKETIKDIDILIISDDAEPVRKTFLNLPEVANVLASGPTKSSVILRDGIQADLRIVEERSFGSALQYFTGSKEHNIKLRQLAIKKGYKINEYGLFEAKTDKYLCGKDEEEIYSILGLQFIPPELREGREEIELAERYEIPSLISLSEIKGDMHIHTNWSDGSLSIENVIEAARQRSYQYVAICDHSASLSIANGLKEDKLKKQIEFIRNLNEKLTDIKLLAGSEVDIRLNGSLDYKDEILKDLDFVIAAIHSGFRQDKETLTRRICSAMENKFVHAIAHPTGRMLGRRQPYEINLERIFEKASETNTILELNAHTIRLDLKDVHLEMAKDYGVLISIGTDTHIPPELDMMIFGVGTARRAYLQCKHVINTYPYDELKSMLNKKRET
jgi:DNA polymerase (family 10)